MQGTRENMDYDNVADSFHPTFTNNVRSEQASSLRDLELSDGDEIRAVHTLRSMQVDGNTEWERSAKTVRKGGIRTRSTRTVRKVTTVTRGEQSVTSESVMHFGSDNAQRYPPVAHDKKSLKFRVIDKVVFGTLLVVGFFKGNHLFNSKRCFDDAVGSNVGRQVVRDHGHLCLAYLCPSVLSLPRGGV